MHCQLTSRPPETAARLDEAIRRSVARAIETGELLDVAAEAGRLAAALPEAAGSRVADLLIRAGVEARINLALGPEPRTAPPAAIGGRRDGLDAPAAAAQ
ncbi:MAG TPA: hypothetical protein VHG92_07730 [Afifellaceae bacterium]|nr:hypothetical protein [Afifellaceae bacterium]